MKFYEKIEDFLEDTSFKQWVLKEDVAQDKFWQEWIASNPSKAELLRQAKTILLELEGSTSAWTKKGKEDTFLAIKDRINASDQKKIRNNTYTYTPDTVGVQNRIRLILGLTLIISFSFALFYVFVTEEDREAISVVPQASEWTIKSNPKGQKSTLQLADGSNVVLNAESELRFKSGFGQLHRELFLSGEAFFEVASDSLPFRVHSGDLITTAMGTSFNINSYQKDWVQVQLATGKVKVINVAKDNESVELIPGEEAVIGENSQLKKGKFDLEKAFFWKDGVLVFNNMPFQEVVRTLERWYAAEIEINNSAPKNLKISAEFKKNTYLKDVLESLGYAYNFDFSIKNKAVKIQFKKVNSL
ncbi:FecR family protein [Cyclobacterium marinum]|uniref:Anti-FecI sigma factor, FecR n=1 Tax=Cyclobacterium marinum (strain ATCC 25205 / DSM 745 / LMG 13164 / NCIMB 1802) TaxID=880070 RepID=G0IZG6_CYCMS|nr:FecR domain-containing protein [Cyclobacterium marinum]AEL25007.1 anti-FecI sigma factor, FecR [Cyclobacterium marinum DSM 745]